MEGMTALPDSDEVPPDPNPPCLNCPHPALDHEGDGWGADETGSWDWFKCFDPDCDCRVKGFLISSAAPQF